MKTCDDELSETKARAEKAESDRYFWRERYGAATKLSREIESDLARERARAEEATKCALNLSVEVSEQKARAEAAHEAMLSEARLHATHYARADKAEEALAAARRECEGLKRLRTRLDEDRSIGKALRLLAQILDGEPTGPGDKRLAAEAPSAHLSLIALAAPADGEEAHGDGTHK